MHNKRSIGINFDIYLQKNKKKLSYINSLSVFYRKEKILSKRLLEKQSSDI